MTASDKFMFALRRPCPKCPFRADVPGYLRRDRAQEIALGIAKGAIFSCHATTVDALDEDGDEIMVEGPNSQFCAGALIVMEKLEVPNQAMRMAEGLGFYDPARLEMSAPVVASMLAFVEHHNDTGEVEQEAEAEVCCVANYGCEAPSGYLVNGMVVAAEEPGETHECPVCGEYVCENCSNDAGVCGNCEEG